jgi:predicted ester cyclase
MDQAMVSEQLNRPFSAGQYRRIRRLWAMHSLAEDRRDIPGLLATLTEDCIYQYIETGDTWQAHAGAAEFYQYLLSAFPDIHFDLTNIVIGPQGVFEEAHVTGTHLQDWLIYPANGRQVEFDVVIFFPWDPERHKFSGERIQAFNFKA